MRLPWSIYAGDRNWVPPLLMDLKKTLSPTSAFFEHGEGQLFLAMQGGSPVGRISAQINHLHNEKYSERTGFFGWFECENNQHTANALFTTARDWLRQRGMQRIRGPFNWDVNGENTGILVEDQRPGPPVLMMSYQPGWYPGLVEGAGFTKCMDIYGWMCPAGEHVGNALATIARGVERRLPGLTHRMLDLGAGYARDMRAVRSLYNDAWHDNWGSSTLTEAEMDVIASGLKPVADPRITALAELDGEPVAFVICLPDLNVLFQRMNGRLFPFGWLTLLRGVKKVKRIRTILLGVRADMRGRGLESVVLQHMIQRGLDSGVVEAELGWVLETNSNMNRLAERLGATRYRTYRIYERDV